MNFLILIFNESIFRPILNLLVIVLNFLPGNDLGWSIIIVTVLTRLVLFPLSHKALKSQKKLADFQPQLKEIQKKHKNNKQKQSQAVMAFYKQQNINPLSGCLPFLIQLPIIIGLYRVFLVDLTAKNLTGLYSFVASPLYINTNFLGVVNLLQASMVLALLSAFAQFLVSKITFNQKKKMGNQPSSGLQGMMGKQMTYILPFITFFIAQSFPAGLVLYWFTTTVFSFGQQIIINKTTNQENNKIVSQKINKNSQLSDKVKDVGQKKKKQK